MDLLDSFRRLGRHGEWADARLLASARAATGDLGVVLRELAHIRGAQETWLSRIEGRPSTLPVWPTLTLDELAALAPDLDAAMRITLDRLTVADLSRVIAYTNSAGVAFETPVGEIIVHLLSHGQYHRGKANAALRAIGAEVMVVDYIVWQRQGG
jgi:uncharacterized damage-inducible protein DinB